MADRAMQLVEAGLLLQMAGDLAGAEKVWTEALRLDPENADAKQYLEALKAEAAAKGDDLSMDVDVSSFSTPAPVPGDDEPTPVAPFELAPPGTSPNMRADPRWKAVLAEANRPPSPVDVPSFPTPPAWKKPDFSGGKTPPDPSQAITLPEGASTPFVPRRAPPPPPLEALRAPPGQTPVEALLKGARDLLDLDDHTGAHETLKKVLALEPGNATAQALLERCEATLLGMWESKIGDMFRRPKVLLRADEVVWLNLDHRAGFVLSLIDGTVNYDDIFTVSAMSRFDTAKILVQLLNERVIE